MRVLYFTRDYTPHDFRFFNAMLDNGFEVWYMRPGKHTDFEVRPIPEGIHPVDWSFGKNQENVLEHEEAVIAELQRVFNELKPDVVHSGPLTDTSYLTAKAGLHPHCAMSWGFDLGREIETSDSFRENARFALSQADWFIGDCYMELKTAEGLGYDPNRATIFPWGIDIRKFSPDPSAKKSDFRKALANEDEILFLSLRTMEPNYSVETVVCGFLKAARQNDRIKLILLADGSQKARLEEIAANDPNGNRVRFLGRQPNQFLVDYYRSADFYLSASIVDGSSVSLLESMACGTPVIVSAIPGNREWVEENKNGLLFPVKDEDTLAEKMLYAAENPEKMRTMAENARKVIEDRADWNKNKLKLKDAYQGAITQCRQ